MASTDSLLVARVGKPHGLRGEVTVQTHTDDPEGRYVPGTVFATEAAAGTGVPRALTLASARKHRETWLLGFEEIPDRTGAESLRGTRLLLDPEELDEDTDDDEGWYEHDLVGLAVVDPSGAALGEVTGLVVGAAQDLLEVRLTCGREALVPFVEAIVTSVDVEGGHVVVDAPAGLFDLDEA
ncbi:16S rRNA-processing protein RimM [Knoellia flava TL1]|uniref:Ribosome maturation factor RimM n=2 Tax=Knoellia flava TaxID=913969 RepID=A0A8H9KV34_9MICO|nr:ribosome maturation factor RimM [Knoellia flava]KGN35156.1 16S rRNA-processing protein RimM [Knoellia flava TL1]GGB86128.1 ribosome maturation factor RimM [Knoellia flava]